MARDSKRLFWIGSSLDDLSAFPDDVKYEVGFALRKAQWGEKHPSVKPLKGFGGAGVLEVVTSFEGSAFRTVYTVKFKSAVYVLHAFQKKSKQGIKTPQEEIDMVKEGLRKAEIHYQEWSKENEKKDN